MQITGPRNRISAKRLARRLGIRWTENPTEECINWGLIRSIPNCVLNQPENVAKAANKLVFLELCKENGIRVPSFGVDAPTEFPVFLRKRHHWGGRDIIICEREDQIQGNWDYWTKLVLNERTEYRIHVFQGNVIFKQRKFGEGNSLIRNLENGWRFSQTDLPLETSSNLAVQVVNLLGLDFGAVDILYDRIDQRSYVLEVNTAPGLKFEGTLNAYAEAFGGIL